MQLLDYGFAGAVMKKALFRTSIGQMRKEVDGFASRFHDDPSHLSGWGHRYFCPDDGGRLIFDPEKPHEHVCSVCGKQFTGKVFDEAWVVFYRNLAFVTVEKAAILYKVTGEPRYLETVKDILSFYTHHYDSFPLHTKEGELFSDESKADWGCGRIMPQGLNESIIMVRSILTLEILKEDLDGDFKKQFHESFVIPFYRMIMPQVNKVHNIPCWNLAGLGCAALYFDDKDMVDFVFHGAFNIRRQLSEGVTSDGFWYEGSIHYNFFLLEGVTTLLLFCHLYNVDFGFESEQTVIRMLQAAYAFAFDNHRFPVPNDGWPDLNLKTFSYVYYMLAKVTGEDSSIGNLIKNIEAGKEKRQTLPLSESYYVNNVVPLERLMFAYDWNMRSFEVVKGKSALYRRSLFAMLRDGKTNLFFKYGLNGPSHAHPDILEFELAYGERMVSRDLSNAGYYSNLCNTWHRKTACHNTLAFDGTDITSREPGELVSYTDTSVTARAQLFPFLSAERSLSISSQSVHDHLLATSGKRGIIDLFFHVEDKWKLIAKPVMQPSTLGFDENGYEYFKDVKKCSQGRDARFVFSDGANSLVVTVPYAEGLEVFIASTPDNPLPGRRTTIIRRIVGTTMDVTMDMQFSETREVQEK